MRSSRNLSTAKPNVNNSVAVNIDDCAAPVRASAVLACSQNLIFTDDSKFNSDLDDAQFNIFSQIYPEKIST